jgi:predicted phage terminase large subunit-like protein
VDELKKALGSVASAGQLQQSPVPRGGSIIKAEWVQIVDVLPKQFTFILQSWDTAFKTGTKNDFSAGTTWGMLDGNVYLIDLIKQKLEMHDLLNAIEGNFARFNAHKMLIEDKASGQSIIQVLKRKFPGQIIASRVDGDKVARCNAVAPMFESGKVFVFNAPWTKDYIKSLTSFPNAQHDDDVDSTTMALAYLHKIQGKNIQQIRTDVFTR